VSLLSVEDVTHRYPSSTGELPVLRGVSLDVEPDSVVAVVGESGCGKTTLGRLVVGLVRPLAGTVRYEGKDIWELPKDEWERYRRAVQVIHQDPYSSLNPGLTVEETLKAGLLHHRIVTRREVKQELFRLLEMVGLDATPRFLRRYPHQLSGGQRQRLVVARTMGLRPRLVVADEAVSMLDVSMRVSVLDLLLERRSAQQLSYVFISHDFGVVRYFSQGGRILVMFFGVVVEIGPADDVIRYPRHPYTFLLLDAIPIPDPRLAHRRRTEAVKVAEERITGEPAAYGCVFSNRCPYAEDKCHDEPPPLVDVQPGHGHQARCWFPERVPDLAELVRSAGAEGGDGARGGSGAPPAGVGDAADGRARAAVSDAQ
jgi:oligopeptide/dipeptide ABC transporter ATP-binding protein